MHLSLSINRLRIKPQKQTKRKKSRTENGLILKIFSSEKIKRPRKGTTS